MMQSVSEEVAEDLRSWGTRVAAIGITPQERALQPSPQDKNRD
jgi:hypothetical protein